jgi:four helix bundle protein
LASQLARAALSVPANIAEGYNRGSLKEYIQFLTISRGSLAEVEYYLLFARDAELVKAEPVKDISAQLDEAGRLLLSLLRSLEQKNGSASRRMIRDEGVPYGTDPDEGCLTDLSDSTLDPQRTPGP